MAKSSETAHLAPTPSKSSASVSARDVALWIAEAGLEKKALDIEIIEVVGKVDYTDYVVVLSGRSDRQVNAIAKGVQTDLVQKHGVKCVGVEGLPQGQWVLLDFTDVVVHIFHQDVRGYYDLETLWIDAPRVEFESPSADDSLFAR